MSVLSRISPAMAATASLLMAGFGISLAVNLPGHLSYDSVIQLLEGREGIYSDWHPAVMSWLLGFFDTFVRGTSLFVIWTTGLLYISALSLLLLPGRTSWVAAPVALIMIVTPQFFLYPGIVWKDVLFAVLAVAAFISLVHVGEFWKYTRLRFGLIGVSCVFLVMTSLARQNGAIAVPIASIALGWIAARHLSVRLGLFYGAMMFMAVAIVTLTARTLLETRVYGDQGTPALVQLLQTYDIVGALKRSPEFTTDEIAKNNPNLARALRTNGAKLYTAERNDTLTKSEPLQAALDSADRRDIAAQWLDLILHHPLLYLKVRWEVFRWVFFTPDLSVCVPFEVGVDGPPEILRALGIIERMDARDQTLERYAQAFVGTPILWHPMAALLALVELVLLLRRKRNGDIVIAAMLVCAAIFTLSFFVISIACDYRYLYFLDISAMIALFYLTRDVDLSANNA